MVMSVLILGAFVPECTVCEKIEVSASTCNFNPVSGSLGAEA